MFVYVLTFTFRLYHTWHSSLRKGFGKREKMLLSFFSAVRLRAECSSSTVQPTELAPVMLFAIIPSPGTWQLKSNTSGFLFGIFSFVADFGFHQLSCDNLNCSLVCKPLGWEMEIVICNLFSRPTITCCKLYFIFFFTEVLCSCVPVKACQSCRIEMK